MKSHLLPALLLSSLCLILLSGIYTLIILGTAQLLGPNKGKGAIIKYSNDPKQIEYGYINIGQSFTDDAYFWSRPSATQYNAAGSGASNKAPSNKEYLEQVNARIDTFLVHNPEVKKQDIPVELVTASGSGLDPHISFKAAFVQIPRIARIRNIPTEQLTELVSDLVESPLFGFLGPAKINVLRLNAELNRISPYKLTHYPLRKNNPVYSESNTFVTAK